MAYKSKYSGEEIDEAIRKVQEGEVAGGGEIGNADGTLIRLDKIDVKTQEIYENMELVEGTLYLIIEDEE